MNKTFADVYSYLILEIKEEDMIHDPTIKPTKRRNSLNRRTQQQQQKSPSNQSDYYSFQFQSKYIICTYKCIFVVK